MKKILIVDDEKELREILTLFLKMKGFGVIEAVSGNTALAFLREEQEVSLIISDIQMPDGDGVYLLKALKQELKSAIPIFMYTGGSNIDFNALITDGASQVFDKPISLGMLLSAIHSLNEMKA